MSEEDIKTDEAETVWQCEGCLKTFPLSKEANEHELTCASYMNLYPEKQTATYRNQSKVKYPALNILTIVYRIMGWICIILLVIVLYAAYEAHEADVPLASATLIASGVGLIIYAVFSFAMAEFTTLLMDLQDNTYQNTELNSSMAISLKSIEDTLTLIAENIEKE